MKIKEYENHRVSVYPDEPLFTKGRTPEELHAEQVLSCRSLIKEIKRHVDFGSVDFDFDVLHSCSFCGLTWEEEDDGQPVCCAAAIAEWEAGRAEANAVKGE